MKRMHCRSGQSQRRRKSGLGGTNQILLTPASAGCIQVRDHGKRWIRQASGGFFDPVPLCKGSRARLRVIF